MKRRVRPMQQLQQLQDQIPGMVDCKGLCHSSCGPVPVSRIERLAMFRRHGRTLPLWPSPVTTTCPLLSEDKRCTVYAARPLLCRMWGAVEGMPCQYGCGTDGPLLSDDQARRLLDVAREIEP